jgi:hypothetical protein
LQLKDTKRRYPESGKFLERTLHTLRLNKKTISKRSLFQCYYCLYNVNVGVRLRFTILCLYD